MSSPKEIIKQISNQCLTELTPFSQFDAFFNILILVTVISLVTWRLKFPPTIAFIIAGVLSSFYIRLELPSISPDIFVSILLPPILFQEALHLEVDGLIDDADSVLSFAILGTLIMQAIIALFAWALLGFDVLEAMIFGILIAPTDPVAVIRVFQSLGVVKRFQIIVSGESLFNDGIAIVVYSILISVVTIGSITPYEIGKIAFITIFGGIIIGLLSGYLAHSIFCWTDDKFAEVLLSFIVAFGVFRLAEGLHASGVLATVIAGVVINYRSRVFGGFSDDSFEMLEAMWEFIGFLASSVAFIFIGMNLDQTVFMDNATQSLVLLLLTITFRFIMVEGISTLLERTRGKEFPRNWRDGLVWSGLRGAISIVLVLGVARILPHGEVMIALTFGVVILSNILQGITMSWVIRSNNLQLDSSTFEDAGSHRIRLSENYSPEGYRYESSFLERVFFSAPEYFIYETRFGKWMADKIIFIMGAMNRYLLNRMTFTPKGFATRIIKVATRFLSNFLDVLNRYISKKELDKGSSKKKGRHREQK